MPFLQLGGIAQLDDVRFSDVGQRLSSSHFRGTATTMVRGATAIAAVCEEKRMQRPTAKSRVVRDMAWELLFPRK